MALTMDIIQSYQEYPEGLALYLESLGLIQLKGRFCIRCGTNLVLQCTSVPSYTYLPLKHSFILVRLVDESRRGNSEMYQSIVQAKMECPKWLFLPPFQLLSAGTAEDHRLLFQRNGSEHLREYISPQPKLHHQLR